MASNVEGEYKITDILGTECIVWLFNQRSQSTPSTKEKTRRKKLKDAVGMAHKDTPMLDIKASSSFSDQALDHTAWVYCDIIVMTDFLEKWEAAIQQHYKHMHCEPRTGNRCVYIDNDEVFVTISYYKNTSKFMVQPGNKLESNLIKWLQSFCIMKDIVLGKNTLHDSQHSGQHVPRKDSPPNGRQLSEHCVTSRDPPPTCSVPNSKSLSDDSHRRKHNAPSDDAQQLETCSSSPSDAAPHDNSPPEQSSPDDSSSDGSPHHDKCDLSCNVTHGDTLVVDNALLCFVQNRMNLLDLLTHICVKFYDKKTIAESKQTLWSLVNPVHRLIKRKGDRQASDDMNDIYRVFLEMKTPCKVKFVVSDLSQIPPTSIDNMDTLGLMQKIHALSDTVTTLTESHTQIVDLLTERQLTSERNQKISKPTNVITSSVHTQTDIDRSLYESRPAHSSKSVVAGLGEGNHPAALGNVVQDTQSLAAAAAAGDQQIPTGHVEQQMESPTRVQQIPTRHIDQQIESPTWGTGDDSSHVALSEYETISEASFRHIDEASLASESWPNRDQPRRESLANDSWPNRDQPQREPLANDSWPNLDQPRLDIHDPAHAYNHSSGVWKEIYPNRNKHRPTASLSQETVHDRQGSQQVVIGKGASVNIQAAAPQQSRTNHNNANKQITGVFVTRLAPKTTPRQIEAHVQKETNINC